MTPTRLAQLGTGIKTTTYIKLTFPIYSGVKEYGILHTAVFGVN